MTEVELILDARAELGEGPVWDQRVKNLIWVDIMRGQVHAFDPGSGDNRTFEVGQPVGAVALRRSGGVILAMRDGFGSLDFETKRVQYLAPVETDRSENRMNDGKCDAVGRFWAGTMSVWAQPEAGALYRLDLDGSVHAMVGGITISNGLDWSLDGRTMYYVDSAASSIDLFDYDIAAGLISNRRTLVSIPHEAGIPDGLTVDSEDFIWLALWGGGALHRYSPSGVLDRIVPVPSKYPTSCTFGGSTLTTLFITTATTELSAQERDQEPHAGGIFRYEAGVNGRLPYMFAG